MELSAAAPSVLPLKAVAPRERPRSDAWAIVVAVICFGALSLAASITSDGFLEADGCTHYLYARYAFAEPHYLVNIWGRPVCTALYAIPAQLGGRFGVRTTSLIVAIGVAFVAYAVARRQGHSRPALALVFTLAQPLLFLHSFAELTELPFALLLGLAFLAYQARRWWAVALLASLLPLSRPEGFGFLLLALAALVAHRQWKWVPLLPVALLVWSYFGWRVYLSPTYPGLAEHLPRWLAWLTWLPNNWPYAGASAYRAGSIVHFLIMLPVIVSPVMFPALWVGVWRTSRGTISRFFNDHQARCDVLIAVIPLGILIGHSLLYATGRMASSGEVRYLLVAAPFWAVLVARGWQWFFAHVGRPHRAMQAAALAAVVPIFVNGYYQVVPLQVTEDWIRARQAAEWVRDTPLAARYPRVLSAHPGVFYYLGISMTDPARAVEWKSPNVARPPAGVIMIWDEMYATHNADTKLIADLDGVLAAGWVPLRVPRVETGTRRRATAWLILLSPTDTSARPTLRK